jgi:hypothetical protein
LVVLFYLALGVILWWHVWATHPAGWMLPGGDAWRNAWFFEWTPWSVLHGHSPLYSGAANYPTGVNVLLNAGAPLLGAVFAPVTLIFGPIAAFNVASTLALPLSATAAYSLMRRFSTWRPAAFVGGLLYGFCPQEAVHGLGGHLNLSFTPLVPLILLAWYEISAQAGHTRRWGTLLGVLVAGEFLVSSELLLDTLVVGAVVTVVAAVAWHRRARARLRGAVMGVAWATGTSVVLLAWPAWSMLRGPGHVNGPVQQVAQAYRADLLGPIVPDSAQLLSIHTWVSWSDHFANSVAENGSYLGLPLLLLLGAGLLWQRHNRTLIVAGICAAAAFVLSLGGALSVRTAPALTATGRARGHVPLPGAVFERVTLLDNAVPARYALMVALMAALAAAVLLDELHRTLSAGRSRRPWLAVAVPVALAGLALAPMLPAGLAGPIGPDVTPRQFTAVAEALPAGQAVITFPYPSGDFPEPIMWQTDTRFRYSTPGGSFFVPAASGRVAFSPLLGYTQDSLTAEVFTGVAHGSPPAPNDLLRTAILDEWRMWHIDAVIAIPALSTDPKQSVAFLTWLLGRPDRVTAAIFEWRHPGGS